MFKFRTDDLVWCFVSEAGGGAKGLAWALPSKNVTNPLVLLEYKSKQTEIAVRFCYAANNTYTGAVDVLLAIYPQRKIFKNRIAEEAAKIEILEWYSCKRSQTRLPSTILVSTLTMVKRYAQALRFQMTQTKLTTEHNWNQSWGAVKRGEVFLMPVEKIAGSPKRKPYIVGSSGRSPYSGSAMQSPSDELPKSEKKRAKEDAKKKRKLKGILRMADRCLSIIKFFSSFCTTCEWSCAWGK